MSIIPTSCFVNLKFKIVFNFLSGIGVYWGYVMMLVRPQRDPLDKYFVPTSAYSDGYYPLYIRGMAYALSEDLVRPLGKLLANGTILPFPYREDVSVWRWL